MDSSHERSHPIGQAIFLRTDSPDFEEVVVKFHSLEEMVEICSKSHPNCVLENVVVYSVVGEESCSLTLGFISASKGQRPACMPAALR